MFEAYPRYEYYFAAGQLSLAMLGMGATLRIVDFLAVFRAPAALLVGLFAQLVLVPLVAFLVTVGLAVDAGIAIGLALVAAAPGGAMSNVVTYAAKGNTALSISLTAVSTLGCLVTTPLVVRALVAAYLPGAIVMPASTVAFEITFCLLLPLALGMGIGGAFPKLRLPISKWGIIGSMLLILAIAVGSTGAGRIQPGAYGWTGPLALLAFAALSQQASLGLAHLCQLKWTDRIAIGVEVAIRNTNLSLLIKASLFPVVAGVSDPVADGALFVALLYGVFALLVSLPLIFIGRRGGAPVAVPEAAAP